MFNLRRSDLNLSEYLSNSSKSRPFPTRSTSSFDIISKNRSNLENGKFQLEDEIDAVAEGEVKKIGI